MFGVGFSRHVCPTGKVLHVEHIELLTAEYKQLKKELSGKKLLEGSLHFTGEACRGHPGTHPGVIFKEMPFYCRK